ncbi:transcriptional activator FtrA [Bremerella volcania]|uniref:Transcriptional activator FtrA n=1 Tax=Bremerella volcania TaxID=2527984 RepID=A0A518CG45_9BACT|nr:AraC family transcriptional regulator [Bremerella volcania]QDU78200.1 transcriptional activator FtrA [Bremerella volcania]
MLSNFLPSPSLRPFVSHYWASFNNRQVTHAIFPDGSVDLVFAADATSADCWLFGTSTSATEVPLVAGTNYLGVRFRPGQARHFMSLATKELTNHHEAASEALRFSLGEVPQQIAMPTIFQRLDKLFEDYLDHRQPNEHRIDQVIRWIETNSGNVRIEEAAGMYGKSRRQLERAFLDCVGISPKLFASIVRFQNAAGRIACPGASLAEVALASGYVDQCHMTNDFRRLTGTSPARFLKRHVAFLQDATD